MCSKYSNDILPRWEDHTGEYITYERIIFDSPDRPNIIYYGSTFRLTVLLYINDAKINNSLPAEGQRFQVEAVECMFSDYVDIPVCDALHYSLRISS